MMKEWQVRGHREKRRRHGRQGQGRCFQTVCGGGKIAAGAGAAAVVVGSLLAVVFGAANAYLGIRVGMTVSASIPAAVISLAVMRVILRRNSLLESNMVQTIGSPFQLFTLSPLQGGTPCGRKG